MSWEDNVRKVVPYVPGEQPKEKNIIKLNTNENPYPPAPGVKESIAKYPYEDLRLYPNPNAECLVEALAKYYQLPKNQIFVGVGSDDVLANAFLTFFNSDKPILFPDITYSFYDVWAELYRIPYICKPLDDHFCLHVEDYLTDNGGIIIANPNAPTGVSLETDVIEQILQKNTESVVIVDEAYVDFGAQTCLPLIDKYENLLVIQTFSKSRSMAGLRVGIAMGSAKMISYLNAVKFSVNSYTMNRPTLAFALASLEDEQYFSETIAKICGTREWAKEQMQRLGFITTESCSNFLFVTHPDYSAEEIFRALKEKKIFVRHFKKPRIDNYLRISIGTDDEMQALISALQEYMSK